MPFTSGSRMPDTGAATVSTVLNRNGLTFGNQLIRHMEQTTIQLNNPGTSNWNVQVTMNNMAVYLPSGFAFDNRGNLLVTTNRIESFLFPPYRMDFSGATGANFHIVKIPIGTNSYLRASSSTAEMS